MSTTIEIIPVETTDITFAQVLETAEKNIRDYLTSMGINHPVRLSVNIHDNREKYVRRIQATDRFAWAKNEYAWFAIEGIAGGTDAYCTVLNGKEVDPENPWWRLEELEAQNKTVGNLGEKLEKSKLLDRRWYFRRSAGQPGMIALGYGLIAASVAELTGGILWSDDGAWDFERFPAESRNFMGWYFRPDKALKGEYADWAATCLAGIADEFTNDPLLQADRPWWKKLFGYR